MHGVYSRAAIQAVQADGVRHQQDSSKRSRRSQEVTFDDILDEAAFIGLDIQSESFWDMRPDNFIRLVQGFHKRHLLTHIPIRRVLAMYFNSMGSDKVQESELWFLEGIDTPQEQEEEWVSMPILLTRELVEQNIKLGILPPSTPIPEN